jgi:RNA polymerase Rpb1, domain 5
MLQTTVGKTLVNDALPPELRRDDLVLDKKGMNELLNQLASTHPESYREVMKRLTAIGARISTESGGYSFGPEHLRKAKVAQQMAADLRLKLGGVIDSQSLTPQQRREMIIRHTGRAAENQIKAVYDESLAEDNPLAMQVKSGARGNPAGLASLRGIGDLLYTDQKDEPIPLPVMHSYSEGLTPAEYWAATYGARKGLLATKFAVQDSGYLGKQLNQISHRMIVVGDEDPRAHNPSAPRGLPVDTEDPDNVGTLLAHDVGGYKRNTVLNRKILEELKRDGQDRILVRSPVVGGAPDGGLYSRDVGVRERGTLPGQGEPVGVTAAQALSEPLNQGQLSAKHSGGVAGQEKAVGGFQSIEQLIQVPKTFKGGAAHSTVDGRVQRIEPAPAGGQYVWIEGQRHYVGHGYQVHVKRGDDVEAGDVLSEGWPNPATIVEHKGIGEGRRYFVDSFCKAMRAAGMKVNRRNVEVLSRGLINHVRLTDETDENVPDDVVPYGRLEHGYQPRDDASRNVPAALRNQYLEEPVLHYSIGTKIRPSVIKELGQFGVKEVVAHPEPPPFQPEMIRGMANLAHDEDFITRMYGSGLKSSFLDAVHRGMSSDEAGTSFVPGLARAVDFGHVGKVQTPAPGKMPEDPNVAKKKNSLNALALKQPTAAPSFSRWGSLFNVGKSASDLRAAVILVKEAIEPMPAAPKMQPPKMPQPQQHMQPPPQQHMQPQMPQQQHVQPSQPQPGNYYQGQPVSYASGTYEEPQMPEPQAPQGFAGQALETANDLSDYGMYGGMLHGAATRLPGAPASLAGLGARGVGAGLRGAGNVAAAGSLAFGGSGAVGQGMYNAGQAAGQWGQRAGQAGQAVNTAFGSMANSYRPLAATGRVLGGVANVAGKAYTPLAVAQGAYTDLTGGAEALEGSNAEAARNQRDLFSTSEWRNNPGQNLMKGLSQLNPWNVVKGGLGNMQHAGEWALGYGGQLGTSPQKMLGIKPSQYMTTDQIVNNRADLESAISKSRATTPEQAAQARQQLEDYITAHTDPSQRQSSQPSWGWNDAINSAYDQAWQKRLQQAAGA